MSTPARAGDFRDSYQQTDPQPAEPRPFGLAAGDFVVPDNFDAPLPDDIISEFEGA